VIRQRLYRYPEEFAGNIRAPQPGSPERHRIPQIEIIHPRMMRLSNIGTAYIRHDRPRCRQLKRL